MAVFAPNPFPAGGGITAGDGIFAGFILDLEGSDVLLDKAGCSLVMVISRFFGNDDMVPVVPGIVEMNDV
ncbi:MAG: hypothetical protein Q9175_008233 [Cornicularia normoerica]